ncbi:hypothetical protein [Salinibacter altiplanensis]|uniref:hypothetical protein n=1 Tax=Salinibacter altiplanensis TaxID=1803181 RepID=UPI001F16A883
MVGRLGPEALAGVALGHTVFSFFAIMGMGWFGPWGPWCRRRWARSFLRIFTLMVRFV